MWEAGLQMVKTRPIEGWGKGSFPVFAGYLGAPGVPTLVGAAPPLNNIAHNYYVTTAAETGLVGLGLYLAILIGFFLRCGRALKEDASQTRKWLLVGAIARAARALPDDFPPSDN